MKHVILAITLTICALTNNAVADAPTDQNAAIAQVQADVRKNVEAAYSGDIDTILKYTHEKVLTMMGGPEKARAALAEGMKKILSSGLKVEKFEFPSPPIFLNGTENEFVIIPTHSIIMVGTQRVESTNYQLGIRKIGTVPSNLPQWTYMEGSRINTTNVYQFFPDFPKGVTFPEFNRKKL